MKRTVFAIVALIVIAPVGPSKGGHYVRDLRAADVNAADDATLVPIVLRVTDHPPVPRDLSQFWMAPDSRRPRTAAQANLATAVKFENEGNHAKALTLLTNPATRQDAALASYAEFYKGLALLRLGRAAEARSTFQALQAARPVGYLSEMAALREAECDETLGDLAAALAVYERLATITTLAPDEILMKIGKTAQALGDTQKAQKAFEHVYYDYPLSDLADDAAAEMPDASASTDTIRFKQDLARADRLFAARQYPAARASFERLRSASQGEDRTVVQLRLAEADYYLRKYRASADALKPFVESGTRPAEALYFFALAQHELKDNALYHTLMRRVVTEFPGTPWAEDALNSLALVDAHDDEDEAADRESLELFEQFPKGRYTERAAWRIGWRAYRRGQFAEAVRIFERAAFNFPRSDYRPAWLYWSGRAHEALNETDLAESRYSIEVIDYLNTYHGRLAAARLGGRIPDRASVVPARALTPVETSDELPSTLPPNAQIVRALLTAKMYDAAADELRYAQKIYGDSGAIQATFAWTYRQQGQAETGSPQLSLYRGSINAMKRAYPQYLTAGGERLPREILRVIYPVAYWDLIQKYSAENGLDPFIIAALMCQESTFVANIRSPAKAVGLMQLEPATARQYAKRLGITYSSSVLTTPELNIRIATAYLGDQLREFGSMYRVLAAYNAGDGRVRRWTLERPGLSQEEWIDDIPFFETQAYVRKLLANAEDYRRLYGTDAGVAPDDEIPSGAKTVEASDVDPTLTIKRKAASVKPAAPPSKPAPVRSKKKKRTAA
jgi:soluble lytic murein transglycosylase